MHTNFDNNAAWICNTFHGSNNVHYGLLLLTKDESSRCIRKLTSQGGKQANGTIFHIGAIVLISDKTIKSATVEIYFSFIIPSTNLETIGSVLCNVLTSLASLTF